jgi:hypothetical protein
MSILFQEHVSEEVILTVSHVSFFFLIFFSTAKNEGETAKEKQEEHGTLCTVL